MYSGPYNRMSTAIIPERIETGKVNTIPMFNLASQRDHVLGRGGK
jgi:hypothetical protein